MRAALLRAGKTNAAASVRQNVTRNMAADLRADASTGEQAGGNAGRAEHHAAPPGRNPPGAKTRLTL